MNDDIERRLRQVTPLGAPGELRSRVLAAVAGPLQASAPLPARGSFRTVLVVAASLLASLALNFWVNDRLDRRLAMCSVRRPCANRPPTSRTTLLPSPIQPPASGCTTCSQWNVPNTMPPGNMSVRLHQLIQQLTLDFKETADEAPRKNPQVDGDRHGRAITILLMLNAYFVWSTGTELERRLATLGQAGDPVQLSDFASEPIPPEKNADVFLRRAAADLDAIEKELLALYPTKGFTTGNLSPDEQNRLGSCSPPIPA